MKVYESKLWEGLTKEYLTFEKKHMDWFRKQQVVLKKIETETYKESLRSMRCSNDVFVSDLDKCTKNSLMKL